MLTVGYVNDAASAPVYVNEHSTLSLCESQHCAAHNSHEARKLITADPGLLKGGGMGSFPPLHMAVFAGPRGREMVEFLISMGADVNAKDSGGMTAMKRALEAGNTEAGNTEVAEFLRAKGGTE